MISVFERALRYSRSTVPFAVIGMAWYFASRLQLISPIFLPSPADVIVAFVRTWSDGTLWSDIGVSAYRVLSGFGISLVIAMPLGLLMGVSDKCRQYVEPFNDLVRYVPVPAMVPLLILWLGLGNGTQIAVIVFGTLPQLLVLISDAATQMPKVYRELCAMLQLNSRQMVWHALLPYAAPQMFDAGRVSIGWAWSYLLVAEIVGANRGLGQHIIVAQRFLQTDQVIVGILVVALLGLSTDILLRSLYPALFPWSERSQKHGRYAK